MGVAVLVVAERVIGEHSDTTFELLGKGRELANAMGGELGVVVLGSGATGAPFGVADTVYAVENAGLGNYAAPNWEAGVAAAIKVAEPKVVLLSTGTVGIDLGGSLAATFGAPLASYVIDLSWEESHVVATSQLYGGKLLAEVELAAPMVLLTVIPGSFPADAGRSGGSPRVETVEIGEGLNGANRGVAVKEPESTGVDITATPLLVSVGRGIGSEANMEVVMELAEVLKVPLSASRPIIDQGWLPKPHQVGKSGKKVTPTIYLALGISGAPEHLEGMRSSEMIIACNTDPKAPIFEVAHYGTTADLFDLVPALVERLEG